MPTVYLALLIPIIVTLVFYLFKKHQFTWWEFFIPIASVLIAVVISKAIIDHTSVQFTEYWGSTVTAVFEEEPYNYWKTETCSRQVPCGTDSEGNTEYCTEYYDCSHQEDVSPSWWAITNLNERFSISEKQHDELVIQFRTKKTIIKTRQNYAPRDRAVGSKGTKFEGTRVGQTSHVYQTSWNGSDETRKAYTSQHTYENRVKASDLTIFNIKMVKEVEVDSLGLFRYPEHKKSTWFNKTNGLTYPTILGDNISKETQEKFRKLNGKFGVSNELRLWILVFENKPMSIAQFQENYWVKGNKNELVVCIGKKGNEIQWSHAFSWAHSAELTAAVQNEVLNLYTYRDSLVVRKNPVIPVTKDIQEKVLGGIGNKLPEVLPIKNPMVADSVVKVRSKTPMLTEQTWNDYYNYLNANLHKFERRSFEEFSYLTVEPSKGAVIFIFIFAFIVSVGVNFWVITNEIYGDSEYSDKYKRKHYKY
jgi:hypothetical protein